MQRATALLVTAGAVLLGGCGVQSYNRRLEFTLENLKYRQRLDQYLADAPTEAQFKDFPLFVRPPKGMELAKTITMADLPPGQYDLAASFLGKTNGSLHILARKKAVKKAAPKKNEPPPPP